MGKIFFGTAGIPLSSESGDSVSGVKKVRELGLDAMELEFVHGVKMGKESARAVRKASEENNVSLSVHAPYYINLNAQEEKKLGLSRHNILQSCRIGFEAGAKIVLFHPGFYMKNTPEEAMSAISKNLEGIVESMEKEGLGIRLGLETTGRKSSFGSLDEVLALCAKHRNVYPVIDFSHLHARSGGSLVNEAAFDELLASVPKKFLNSLHIHAAGMNFSSKGERNHLNLGDDGNTFNYKAMLKSLKKFDLSGTIICESPNIEEDALLMKKFYSKF